MPRDIDLIKAQIEVDKSDAEKQTTVINAKAEAEAVKARNNAEAEMRSVTIQNQKEAWENTKKTIGFTANKDLLQYIYLNNLAGLKNKATLVYGVDEPTIRYKTDL